MIYTGLEISSGPKVRNPGFVGSDTIAETPWVTHESICPELHMSFSSRSIFSAKAPIYLVPTSESLTTMLTEISVINAFTNVPRDSTVKVDSVFYI